MGEDEPVRDKDIDDYILAMINAGVNRPFQLEEKLGASHSFIANRIKKLFREGLLHKEMLSGTKVRYSLTERGQSSVKDLEEYLDATNRLNSREALLSILASLKGSDRSYATLAIHYGKKYSGLLFMLPPPMSQLLRRLESDDAKFKHFKDFLLSVLDAFLRNEYRMATCRRIEGIGFFHAGVVRITDADIMKHLERARQERKLVPITSSFEPEVIEKAMLKPEQEAIASHNEFVV